MRKLMALVGLACCTAVVGGQAAGAATLSVDAKNSCFDLTTGKLFGTSPAFLPLPNGKYTASMTSTATLGASGARWTRCTSTCRRRTGPSTSFTSSRP